MNNGFQRSSHKQAIIGVISYFFYGLLLLKKANFHTNDVIQWLTTKDEYAKRRFLLRWVKHITSVPRHNGIDEKPQYVKFKIFKINIYSKKPIRHMYHIVTILYCVNIRTLHKFHVEFEG